MPRSRSLSPVPATTVTASQRQRNGSSRTRSPVRRSNNNGSNKRVLRSVSADRDRAYFNVLGTDCLVSSQHVLQELELTRTTETITKLELEDIVGRKQNQQEIFEAIHQLLSNDDRAWDCVKFTDTIRVFSDTSDEQSSSRAMFQLIDYETKQQDLWELILKCEKCKGHELPLSFEVKIMIDEGTSIESYLKLMRLLQNSDLDRVEFGGGLFGLSESLIPDKLVSLFLEIKALDDNEKLFYCTEMIMINLFYAHPKQQDENQDNQDQTTNRPVEVVTKCIHKLTNLKTGKPERRTQQQQRSLSPNKKKQRSKSPKLSPQSSSAERQTRSKSPNSTTATNNIIASESPPSQKDDDDAQSHWRSAVDPATGDTYYYHKITKETFWAEKPPAPAATVTTDSKADVARSNSKARKSRKDRFNKDSKSNSDPLSANTSHHPGGKSSHAATTTSRRPRRHRRQNSMPETTPDISFVRQNTPDFRWDKMAKYQVTIRSAAA